MNNILACNICYRIYVYVCLFTVSEEESIHHMAGSGSWDGSQSDNSSQFEPGIDNIYEAFICPLTKQVMHNPVTLENGQTFEREAIEKWFKQCRENGQPLSCPITSKELSITDLSPSIALRNTIEEWRARNDALKLDIARQSLYLANAETNILQALKNVREICRNIRKIRHRVRNPQLVRLITDMLKSSSHEVRYNALQTLQVVVEGDEESKVISLLSPFGLSLLVFDSFVNNFSLCCRQ